MCRVMDELEQCVCVVRDGGTGASVCCRVMEELEPVCVCCRVTEELEQVCVVE